MDKRSYRDSLIGIMRSFRKLHLFKLVPELNHGEIMIIGTIAPGGCRREMLDDDKGMKVSDIVKATKAPAPAISRALSSLEEKGLIERTADRSDRRNTLVSLTEKGIQMNEHVISTFDEYMDGVFGRLDDKEIEKGLEAIGKLLSAAQTELEERTGNVKMKGGKGTDA